MRGILFSVVFMLLAIFTVVFAGCGEESEKDTDGDGVPDNVDNCADVANADQKDANENSIGDACDKVTFAPFYTVLTHDPANAALGETLFSVIGGEGIFFNEAWAGFGYMASVPMAPPSVDRKVLVPEWEYANFDEGEFNLVEVLSDGHLMGIRGKGGGEMIVEIDPLTVTVVRKFDDKEYSHDIVELPDGNLLVIWSETIPWEGNTPQTLKYEHVAVIDRAGNMLWDWNLWEEAPDAPASEQYVAVVGLWSNCNALDFTPSPGWTVGQVVTGNIFLNCRVQNRLYNIAYPSGEIVWIMGDDGDFGEEMFHHPHDPQITYDTNENGERVMTHILLYDNREAPILGTATACPPDETCEDDINPYSRAMEIAVDNQLNAEIVWKWPSPSMRDFEKYAVYSPIAGGVSRLPNGNILVTNATVGGNPFIGAVTNARIWELKRDGTLTGAQVVWDVEFSRGFSTFKAIRLPEGTTDTWASVPVSAIDTPE
ncbi:MAG: aryl-sulfate sulfotransferase [Deltaproteobacteria bacterium]|nr:aryl-sulfate sulfotransferase [Deltaproteobacteria bacterium]